MGKFPDGPAARIYRVRSLWPNRKRFDLKTYIGVPENNVHIRVVPMATKCDFLPTHIDFRTCVDRTQSPANVAASVFHDTLKQISIGIVWHERREESILSKINC